MILLNMTTVQLEMEDRVRPTLCTPKLKWKAHTTGI